MCKKNCENILQNIKNDICSFDFFLSCTTMHHIFSYRNTSTNSKLLTVDYVALHDCQQFNINIRFQYVLLNDKLQ